MFSGLPVIGLVFDSQVRKLVRRKAKAAKTMKVWVLAIKMRLLNTGLKHYYI
jgi:hypothetical protein